MVIGIVYFQCVLFSADEAMKPCQLAHNRDMDICLDGPEGEDDPLSALSAIQSAGKILTVCFSFEIYRNFNLNMYHCLFLLPTNMILGNIFL